MRTIREIPEIALLESKAAQIRIPAELDVPLSARVCRLIDTPEFQRLKEISQLGLVGLVYPAANHTRFEHALGVYRLALLYLRRLSYDERFSEVVTAESAELLIVAALVHDLGHWPFCHAIEDVDLPSVPRHEFFANSFVLEGEIAELLVNDWGLSARDVTALLSDEPQTACQQILGSILSGPIDIDKMDYLDRDSLHAGVPYGRNFDRERLIGALCLNEAGTALAINEKGKTAAEMMVFARYVMFSEVYWHHAVRAATAMLQRAFYALHGLLDLDALFRTRDTAMIDELQNAAEGTGSAELLEGLFGSRRRLYKRLAQFSYFEDKDLYLALAGRPYRELVSVAEQFAQIAGQTLETNLAPHEILLDAPPVSREVEFDVEVYFSKQACYRKLGEISPVVRTLAREQFDNYVKRVRMFAHPGVVDELRKIENLSELLLEAVKQVDRGQ